MGGMALWMLGGLTGLALNVLLDTLPQDAPPWRPRCPACGAQLPWSVYAFGLRACPYCGVRRRRPWAVVLGLALGTAVLYRHPGPLGFWPAWGFLVYSVFEAVLDVEHRILFPQVELLAGVMAAAFGIGRRGWLPTLLGGLAGVAVMGAFYLLGRALQKPLARRGHGHPEEPPLGLGDVLLSGVLGLLFGWPGAFGVLLLGVFAAGGFGLLALTMDRLRGRKRPMYLPYAPFLLLGGWLLLLISDLS